MNTLRGLKSIPVLAGVLLSFSILLFAGCGSDEEESSPQPTQSAETPTAAAPEAKTTVAPPPPTAPPAATPVSDPPAVLVPLAWTPDDAQAAVGIPSFNGFLDRAVPLAKRLAPDPAMVDEALNGLLDQFATFLGLESAASFGSAAAAKGIDLDNPAALFVDFSAAMKLALEAAQSEQTGAAPNFDIGTLYKDPSLLLLFSLTDEEIAKATAEDLLARAHVDQPVEKISANVGDARLTLYPRVGSGYFVEKGYLAVGDISLLQGVAAKFADPLTLRYGTAELPASSDQEIVGLVFGDRIMPFYHQLAEAVPENSPPEVKQALQAQMDLMERLFGSGEASDPIVTTINLDSEKLDIASRIDTRSHPSMLELAGTPAPLQFLKLLPEKSLAAFGMRFTDATKELFKAQYLPLLQAQAGEGAAATTVLATSILDALGEEALLTVTTGAGPLPQALLLVDLANAESAKVILSGMATPSGQSHRDTELYAFGMIFPVMVGIAGNTLVASNDIPLIQKTIDMVLDGTATQYASMMTPPLDPATPRYQLLMLDPALVLQAVSPWMGLANGGIPPAIERSIGALNHIRATAGMEDTWISNRFTVYLNP